MVSSSLPQPSRGGRLGLGPGLGGQGQGRGAKDLPSSLPVVGCNHTVKCLHREIDPIHLSSVDGWEESEDFTVHSFYSLAICVLLNNS